MDHKTRKVWAVGMACSRIEHREKKSEERTAKYESLRFELNKQYPGYNIELCKIIIDALGGWSRDLDRKIRKLSGSSGYDVSTRM